MSGVEVAVGLRPVMPSELCSQQAPRHDNLKDHIHHIQLQCRSGVGCGQEASHAISCEF